MSRQAQAGKDTNCLLTLAPGTQHYRNVLRTVEVLGLALFLRKQIRGSTVHTWSRVRPELCCIMNMSDKTPAVLLSSKDVLWPLNIPGYGQA